MERQPGNLGTSLLLDPEAGAMGFESFWASNGALSNVEDAVAWYGDTEVPRLADASGFCAALLYADWASGWARHTALDLTLRLAHGTQHAR